MIFFELGGARFLLIFFFFTSVPQLHILLMLVVRGLLSSLIQRIIVRVSDRPLLRVIGNSRATYLRMPGRND